MTGCLAAIAAAQRRREAEMRCPAQKHRGVCRRAGGPKQCGVCAGDLREQDVSCGGAGASLVRVRVKSDARVASLCSGHSATTPWENL